MQKTPSIGSIKSIGVKAKRTGNQKPGEIKKIQDFKTLIKPSPDQ
ncbi:hypothetical protein QG37_05065 [Candidozyma auris]|uniref:Uncharacterized protein n=1 Tax=Candidozyma auris TaxID=498019 RepID=A0A0L0NVA7_CANAR|nr:hypothetical protein QG37_05065 [[Candida] auris]